MNGVSVTQFDGQDIEFVFVTTFDQYDHVRIVILEHLQALTLASVPEYVRVPSVDFLFRLERIVLKPPMVVPNVRPQFVAPTHQLHFFNGGAQLDLPIVDPKGREKSILFYLHKPQGEWRVRPVHIWRPQKRARCEWQPGAVGAGLGKRRRATVVAFCILV